MNILVMFDRKIAFSFADVQKMFVGLKDGYEIEEGHSFQLQIACLSELCIPERLISFFPPLSCTKLFYPQLIVHPSEAINSEDHKSDAQHGDNCCLISMERVFLL
jgi:hypothetical protein